METKTDEFLQKLAPCIERGDLDACGEEMPHVAEYTEPFSIFNR